MGRVRCTSARWEFKFAKIARVELAIVEWQIRNERNTLNVSTIQRLHVTTILTVCGYFGTIIIINRKWLHHQCFVSTSVCLAEYTLFSAVESALSFRCIVAGADGYSSRNTIVHCQLFTFWFISFWPFSFCIITLSCNETAIKFKVFAFSWKFPFFFSFNYSLLHVFRQNSNLVRSQIFKLRSLLFSQYPTEYPLHKSIIHRHTTKWKVCFFSLLLLLLLVVNWCVTYEFV